VHTSKNTAEQIRTRLRAARAAMGVAQRQQDNEAICSILSRWLDALVSTDKTLAGSRVPIVAGFWPLAGEPDLTPVLSALDAHGVLVTLPVMMGPGLPLEFHRWHRNYTLPAGPFGVRQPVRTESHRPDILLVPTLGYTRQADRIGYGAGFYDRTLAAMRDAGHVPLAVGIGWREGLITTEADAYQPRPHDMPLSAILTPDGWLPGEPSPARSRS
jgi:5-formyltetrahydrofolate cyclo-ligase